MVVVLKCALLLDDYIHSFLLRMFSDANMNMFFRFEVGSLSVCMPLKRSKEKITFFL